MTCENCSCMEPSFTNVDSAISFLARRLNFAGVSDGVAQSYAADLKKIIESPEYKTNTQLQDEIDLLNARIDLVLQYLEPHLSAPFATFTAPDWAIQIASLITGGDGCGWKPGEQNGQEVEISCNVDV